MDNEFVLDSLDWLLTECLKREKYTLCGIDFRIIELSDELKVKLKEVDGYENILEFAADHGMDGGLCRTSESELYREKMVKFWQLDRLKVDGGECLKQRVGEKVCDISGLTAYIEQVNADEVEAERLALEENGTAIVDSDDPNFDMTAKIEDLDDDFNAAIAVNA